MTWGIEWTPWDKESIWPGASMRMFLVTLVDPKYTWEGDMWLCGQTITLTSDMPIFKCWLCRLQVVWPWLIYFNLFSLKFLTLKSEKYDIPYKSVVWMKRKSKKVINISILHVVSIQWSSKPYSAWSTLEFVSTPCCIATALLPMAYVLSQLFYYACPLTGLPVQCLIPPIHLPYHLWLPF